MTLDPAATPADATPEPVETPPAAPDPVAAIAGAPSAEDVRKSPEYLEVSRQNRELGRARATAEREAKAARGAAEQARLAAEAQQQADLAAQIEATLGPEGVVAFNEIAALSGSDPLGAARRMAELMARGQTPDLAAAALAAAADPKPQEGNVTVPQIPRSGVGADAPLGQPSTTSEDEYTRMAGDLEAKYGSIVERVQDPALRRRVTTKDRAEGFISYVASAVLKAGVRPKQS